MAEIDTAAPFASVRDAIYMFGENSSEKIQRAFLSTHDLQLEVQMLLMLLSFYEQYVCNGCIVLIIQHYSI